MLVGLYVTRNDPAPSVVVNRWPLTTLLNEPESEPPEVSTVKLSVPLGKKLLSRLKFNRPPSVVVPA